MVINRPILEELMHTKKPKPDKSAKMKLKLLVDNKSSKVLFAEADKEFVDFLFSLLALPLGTVTRLLKQNDGMVGSLGVMYNSFESLSESYIQPNLSKEAVLCPKVQLPFADNQVPLLKCEGVEYAQKKKFYRCSNCKSSKLRDNPDYYVDDDTYVNRHCNSKYVTENPDTKCPSCRHSMNMEVTFYNPSSVATEKGGYVKGVVTYMVMDDLDVKPMSTISSISLLNKFNIKDVGVLVEMTVSIGMAEGLKLLRASLSSKTVLTDVFLRKTDA